ncbi:MAG: fimbria/pilus outer membrane usher protein [Sulfuricaulis sp.]|uniref:fimbria/pilus outer membrane usher protein n=1 Tax=Sulfuricaulis sp. TaxID=2003553 RepID=UPI0025E3F704|nr:fimbria/pilus outer membrane usher protein [Sulfuricaulis sp.]MCR4347460.1 fimbria/pilus outer membrane usher protein [Sulfuricaulis sp.]
MATEPFIVEITLNGVTKGAFVVVATGDGDYWVREEDLKTMEVQPPYGKTLAVDGESFFSLHALRATEIRFDEGQLTLAVALPAELLSKNVLDLLPDHPQRVVQPRDNSAFFNYRALQSGDNVGGAATLMLGTELGVRIGDFLFRSESTHSHSGNQRQDVRYGTSLTRDNRETMQRLIMGDFAASSGDLGGGLNLGGVSFSKSFQIDPYFIRQPMAGFTAAVTAPAEAEIFIDDVRIRTEKLPPGQFELKNLNYYGGQREVAMVLRDRFGREQRLEYPYYFTDQSLRAGLHEYSYNAGLQRQQLGVLSNQYGGWALSAFHRYGVNDALTLGARGEAEQGRFNFGPLGVLRSDRWGVASAALSFGSNPGGSGWAGVARYAFQARSLNTQFALRHHSREYETLGQPATADRLQSEISASAGYEVAAIGNFSIDYRNLKQYQGADQRSVSVGYSKTLSRSVNLLASVGRVTGTSPSTNFFVALTYSPDRDFTAHFSHERRGGTTSDSFQIGNTTPTGEGLGYHITGDRTAAGAGEIQSLAPSLQYNGPHGIYSADIRTERMAGGGSRQAYRLGIGGGIAYVAGTVAFLRPVTDSFGIVEVGKLPGVRVYHSAQEIGRTDAQGRIFLSNLGSYQANRVAIDDRDIPIEYLIGEKEINVSPPLRSGSLIRFEVSRMQVLTGYLRVRVGAESRPAEYLDLSVTVNGKAEIFPTGKGGELYLENLKPGSYRARFDYDGRHCEFDLSVPDSQEMLIELGELHVCEFAK